MGIAREFQDTRAKHLSNQVEAAIKQELFGLVEKGSYPVPSYTPPSATNFGTQALSEVEQPVFKDVLHYVAFRGNSLPIKQTVIYQFQQQADKLQDEIASLRLKEIIKAHNDCHNESGESFQDSPEHAGTKRKAEDIAEDLVAGGGIPQPAAIAIAPHSGDPTDLAALKGKTSINLVEASESCFQHVFTEAGEWFFHGLDGGIASDKVRLATIKGKYRSGQAAVSLMSDGGQTHKLEMRSDDHLVCIQVAGALPKTLDATPLPLKFVMDFLESCGKVRVSVIGHTVEPKTDGSGYTVKCNDTVAMQVKTEASGRRLSTDNIAGLVDMKLLDESPYVRLVDTWQYQVNKNKLVPGYPTVWFQKPIIVKKDQLSNLTPQKSA